MLVTTSPVDHVLPRDGKMLLDPEISTKALDMHALSFFRILKLEVSALGHMTTDTNNYNSCMTKHILPYKFIMCCHTYLNVMRQMDLL